MIAVISDIHANLEALTSVLADIDRQGVERIVCLGDIVGYGPDPVACLDLIRERCGVVLLGNWDQAAMFLPDGFGRVAEESIFWTKGRLEDAPEAQREMRRRFLAERPRCFCENGNLYVHGSARNPLYEYVYPEDIYNSRKMERNFALVDRTCFQGHTHVPGVFVEESPEDLYQFRSPDEIDNTYYFDSRKTLVNVGSVGQPRDADPRACYALLDEGDHVLFRRVEYDVEATIAKIYCIPVVDNFLGNRLRDGR